MNTPSGMAVVTLLGNVAGMGPGHSMLAIGNDVYSFEGVGFGSGGGWQFFNTRQYVLQMNRHRPSLVQELHSSVAFKPVVQYLAESLAAGDLYLVDGVCSSQVALAVARGAPGRFKPIGLLPPELVAWQLASAGLVTRHYYYWPDEPRGGFAWPQQSHTLARLKMTYPTLPPAPPNGIVTWGKFSLPKVSPPPSATPPTPAAPHPAAAQAPRADWLTGVQYRLRHLGHFSGAITGQHNAASQAAVKAFQRTQQIAVDGIPGPVTQGRLVTACGF
ncbi:MAG: peptidoglycan-binding domain-containing protein [Rubrivivax sp.]|jgi:hypothetical protein